MPDVDEQRRSSTEDALETQSRILECDPIVRNTVVIPAYNEEEGLASVLAALCEVVDGEFEVLVVDDGSTDATAQVASRFPCRVIRHPENRGKGEALKTGIRNAHGENVIWIDADGTYPVDKVPAVARALTEGYGLIYASRRWGRDSIPAFNRIGNRLFEIMTHVLYGFVPQDPCTGLCGVKRVYLEEMALESRRFGIESEIAVKASRMKLRMADLPITYGQRLGKQKLRGPTAGLDIFLTIMRYLFWKPARKGSGVHSHHGSP